MNKECEVREKIMDVTKNLYVQFSYKEISLSMITEKANISKGAIYWYFKSKEDLFDKLFEECYNKVVDYIHITDFSEASTEVLLRGRIKKLIQIDRRDFRDLAVIERHLERMRSIMGQEVYPYGAFREDVEGLIEKGFKENAFADLPKDLIEQTIYNFNNDLVCYYRMHPQQAEDESEVDRVISIMLRAILKETPQNDREV